MDVGEQRPKVDPMQLRKDGRFRQAVEMYSQLYSEDGRPFHIYNRGVTYLQLGEYSAALEDFELATTLQDPSSVADSYFLFRGVCHWYLNEPSLTVDVWRQGLTAPYTDAAGGVAAPALLLYAAERLHDQTLREMALSFLRRHAQHFPASWPGPIAPFLLEKISDKQLRKAIEARTSEILQSRWLCQAEFYIALRALREGDRQEFKVSVAKSAAQPYGFHHSEYYLARFEVERDYPESVFG